MAGKNRFDYQSSQTIQGLRNLREAGYTTEFEVVTSDWPGSRVVLRVGEGNDQHEVAGRSMDEAYLALPEEVRAIDPNAEEPAPEPAPAPTPDFSPVG